MYDSIAKYFGLKIGQDYKKQLTTIVGNKFNEVLKRHGETFEEFEDFVCFEPGVSEKISKGQIPLNTDILETLWLGLGISCQELFGLNMNHREVRKLYSTVNFNNPNGSYKGRKLNAEIYLSLMVAQHEFRSQGDESKPGNGIYRKERNIERCFTPP